MNFPAQLGILAVTAATFFAPTTAFALTKSEIGAAVKSLDLSQDRQCAKDRNTGLDIDTDVVDLNGDGSGEVIASVSLHKDLTYCHGQNNAKFVAAKINGKWLQILSVETIDLKFVPRSGAEWPDAMNTSWGYFDTPVVYRFQNGQYVSD